MLRPVVISRFLRTLFAFSAFVAARPAPGAAAPYSSYGIPPPIGPVTPATGALVAARQAARNPDNSVIDRSAPPLQLEECVAQALAKNFSVKIQTYPVDQAKASVVIAQAVYDPVLGLSWQKSVTEEPAPIVTTGAQYPYTNQEIGTGSIMQNLITGGSVTGAYSVGRDLSNIPDFLNPANPLAYLNPAYLGNASLTVSQPLLQGAGIDYSRASIQITQFGAKIASLNLKTTVLATIDNVETAYYNLIFARQQYEEGLISLNLAKELYNQNVIKRNTGVLTNLDVLQAETGVATAESQLVGYKQTVLNNEDTLLQALGEREFKIRVGPTTLPPLPDTNVDFDYSYKLARDNGPTLAIIQAAIEQYQLAALRAKRNNLPQLNATGGVGYASAETTFNEANSRIWNGPGYNWEAGVTLSFPWGLRSNRALYRQAMDNVFSEQATLDQTDQTLVVNVRAAVRAVQSNVEGLAAATKAATLAEKQYELELAEFKVGLVTSYDVLLTQNQLEAAKVAEIQARVNLYNALANLHMLEGTSLQTYRVNLTN